MTSPQRSRSLPVLQAIPNLLSLTRLALGIAFPLMPAEWRLAALLTAAATEFLDGQAARLLGALGTIGRILDPIADKVFMIAVLATLLVAGPLKAWQLIALVPRDVVVTGGAIYVAARLGSSALRRMAPAPLGKLTTATQFLFVVMVVATGKVNLALLIIGSLLSAAAAIDYLVRFRRPAADPATPSLLR
jgi:cardiolipin synthase